MGPSATLPGLCTSLDLWDWIGSGALSRLWQNQCDVVPWAVPHGSGLISPEKPQGTKDVVYAEERCSNFVFTRPCCTTAFELYKTTNGWSALSALASSRARMLVVILIVTAISPLGPDQTVEHSLTNCQQAGEACPCRQMMQLDDLASDPAGTGRRTA